MKYICTYIMSNFAITKPTSMPSHDNLQPESPGENRRDSFCLTLIFFEDIYLRTF